MKTVQIGMLLVAVLVRLCQADDVHKATQDTFVPSTYVHYQKYLLPNDKLAEAVAGGTNYINTLLDIIETPMPDNDLWLRKADVLANPTGITDAVRDRLVTNERHYNARIFSAETLKRLVDHDIRFTTDQIDRMVKNLDHPDPSVVAGVHDALVQTFGVWFVEGEQWVYKPENVRKNYKDAWRKFWSQNRDRYGSNLPLIINDLCMEASLVETNGTKGLRVVITNHGTNDWDIITEVPGSLKMQDGFRPGVWWQTTYVLILGERMIYPIEPVAYVISESSGPVSPAQIRSMPDRPVHLERVHISAGHEYNYLLNLTESFPKEDLRGKKVVLSYKTWETNIKGPFWRGELRSNAVLLKP